MWAATIVIFTAGSAFKRAASPVIAATTEFKDTTAGGGLGAFIVIITDWRWPNWTWRRGAWIWRILAIFNRVRRLYCNSTKAYSLWHIPLHPYVAVLSPAWSPRVPDYPVIKTILRTISYHIHTMVQWQSTFSSKYTLKRFKKARISAINLWISMALIRNYPKTQKFFK